MSSKRRKKKKQKIKVANIIGTLLILGVIGYLIYYGLNSIFFVNNDTYSAEYNRYEITSNHDAIVVRNEIVVKSSISGSTEYFVAEGERVKKDEPVVRITKSTETEALAKTEESNAQATLQLNLGTTDAQIDALKEAILFAINEKKYSALQDLSDALSVELSSKARILENQKSESSEIVFYNPGDQSPVQTYKAPAAGIVTYVADGFESVLSYDGINLLDFNVIFNENMDTRLINQPMINASEPIFKIIDNTKCYLILTLKDDDMSAFSNMRQCTIVINSIEHSADVLDVYPTSKGGIAILRLSSVFDGFESVRKLNVNVKLSDYQGIKLQRSSLIKVDGVLGIYTVDLKRLISFTPVKILNDSSDEVIVFHKNFFDDSGNMIKTVQVKDTVISDPTSVKPGSYLP